MNYCRKRQRLSVLVQFGCCGHLEAPAKPKTHISHISMDRRLQFVGSLNYVSVGHAGRSRMSRLEEGT
jgi:hypothetical protein